jgi:hypothetical protein
MMVAAVVMVVSPVASGSIALTKETLTPVPCGVNE